MNPLAWAVASIVKRPWTWVLIAVVVAVLLASRAVLVDVDNSLEMWFNESDSAVQDYHQFQAQFGNDETVVLVFDDENRTDDDAGTSFLRELTAELATVPGVRRVYSPTAGRAAGFLYSEDRRAAAVIVQLEHFEEIDRDRGAIIAGIDETASAMAEPAGRRYSMGGVGVVYEALNQLTLNASMWLFAASYGLTLFLFTLFVRDWRLVLSGATTLLLTVGATMGLFALTGRTLNMVTLVVPSVVTIYAVSDLIHIVYSYRRAAEETPVQNRTETVTRAARHVAVPCLMTSVTTAAGFAALTMAPLKVIADLGILCAAGVLIAYVVCTIAMTATLALLPHGRHRGNQTPRRGKAGPQAWRIAFVGIAVMLVMAVGMVRIVVDTYSIELLPRRHRVRQESERIESVFGNYVPVELILEAPDIGPRTYSVMGDLETAISELPSVSDIVDVVDLQPRLRTIQTADEARILLAAIPPIVRSTYVDLDKETFRMTVRARMMSARGYQELMSEIDQIAGNVLTDDGYHLSPSGYIPLYVSMIDRVTRTQIRSACIALGIVLLLMIIYARSVALSVAMITANLAPLAAAVGAMGWLGIPLDIGTVTIASIAIGIMVDDTIHMLHAIRTNPIGMDGAIADVRRPMVATSTILAAGFLVLGLAPIASISNFGIVAALVVGLALFGDLWIFPVVAGSLNRRSRRA